MFPKLTIIFLLAFLFLSATHAVHAQQPRPTPTNVPLTTPTITAASSSAQESGGGSIRGAVYEDTNGDGKCGPASLDSGGAVSGVTIEFISSDAKTVLTLNTGSDGSYGLVAAGYSYWGVTAKPSNAWIVTSQQTIYVPIFEDSLVATNINFCLQKATTAKVVLPASGAPANTGLLWVAIVGVILTTVGAAAYANNQTSRRRINR